MAIVIGIKFKNTQKMYYFDPLDIEFTDQEFAIVDTVRGLEFGKVVMANKEVEDKDIVLPLKPIIRKATEEDIKRNEENLAKKEYLISNTTKKVNERNIPMKIVDAEYTFDQAKIIIYFTAEARIDFRDLVKDLASIFRLRIELRQIYERDDIKIRGALATCGRPCCCTEFLGEYDKVSIKMAKLQGLSLNPSKISGCCGKLMCCLRFENDYYQETFKKMPKLNTTIKTPAGDGVVLYNDILRQIVKVRVEEDDGSYAFKDFPLSELKAFKTQSEDEIEVLDTEIKLENE